jgi:TP901 family phage tail tape measure protein
MQDIGINIIFKAVKKGYDKTLNSIKSDAQGLSKNLGKIGAGMTASLTLPILGAGAAAINAAGDFQKSMSNIGTLIDNDETKIKALSSGIKEMLKTTPKSADDLGAAAYNIVSAGITESADAMKVLKASSKLAVAGLGETTEAVDVITSAINAYGLKASESNDIADTFFKGVQAGKTTVAELAQGFGRIAPLAEATNVGFKELIAATSGLTTSGLKASEAYSQIRGLLTNLIKPTKTLENLMQQAGITNIKTAIQTDGLVATMNRLKQTANDNGIAFDKAFGSIEGTNAALALTGQLGGKVNGILDTMKNAGNSVDAAFKSQQQTFDALWQTLKNNLNLAFIELGTTLLPLAISGSKILIGVIQTLTSAWNAMGKPLQYVVITLGGLVAAGGPLLVMMAVLPKITAGLASVSGGMTILKASILPVIAKLAILTAAFYSGYQIGKKLVELFDPLRNFFDAAANFKIGGMSIANFGIEQPAGLSAKGQALQAQMSTTVINNPTFDTEQQLRKFTGDINTDRATAPAF